MTFALDAPEPSMATVLRRDPGRRAGGLRTALRAPRRCGPPPRPDARVARRPRPTTSSPRSSPPRSRRSAAGSGPTSRTSGRYVLRSVRHECQRSWRRGGPSPDVASTSPTSPTARRGSDDDFARRDERERAPRRVRRPAGADAIRPVAASRSTGWSHAEIARRTRSTHAGRRPARPCGPGARWASATSQAHLGGHRRPPACRSRARRPRRVAGRARPRHGERPPATRRSTEHLADCPACAAAHDDLCVVNERLRGLTLLAAGDDGGRRRSGGRRAWRCAPAGWLLGSSAPLTAAATIVVADGGAVGGARRRSPIAVARRRPSTVEPADADAVPRPHARRDRHRPSTNRAHAEPAAGSRPQASAPTAGAIDAPVTTLASRPSRRRRARPVAAAGARRHAATGRPGRRRAGRARLAAPARRPTSPTSTRRSRSTYRALRRAGPAAAPAGRPGRRRPRRRPGRRSTSTVDDSVEADVSVGRRRRSSAEVGSERRGDRRSAAASTCRSWTPLRPRCRPSRCRSSAADRRCHRCCRLPTAVAVRRSSR